MGTALTERQLREIKRLTRNLSLCFDADAAGQEATLRGMELAIAQGFEIRVVSLPPGTDPADDPSGFEERLRTAEGYLPTGYASRSSGRCRTASVRSSASARSLRRFPIRPSGRMPFASPPTGSAFPPSCRQGSLPPRAPVAGR